MAKSPKSILHFKAHSECSISMLSTEAPQSNYRGFFNLAVIIMIFLNFRLMVENVMKYGLLFTLPNFNVLLFEFGALHCFVNFIGFLIPVTMIFYVETRLALKTSQSLVTFIDSVLMIAMLASSPIVIAKSNCHYCAALLLMFFTCSTVMKVYSFTDVMKDLRKAHR